MNINKAYPILKHIVTNQKPIPVHLAGPAGCGKSALVKQLAKDLDMRLFDLRVSLHPDPVDWGGICGLDNGRTVFYPPSFLPSPQDPPTIIFLDEINTAPPATQALCYQMLLEHRVREHDLGKQHRFVSAGNRAQDRAITHTMASPLVSRMAHLEIEPDADSFTKYALDVGIRESIIGFINFRPEKLSEEPSNSKPFACPRTWEMAAQLPDEPEFLNATVGEAATAEYLGYLNVYKELPLISDIIRNPQTTRLIPNENTAAIYAVVWALVYYAVKREGYGILPAVDYINRWGNEEWIAMYLNGLSPHTKKFKTAEEFSKVVLRYSKILTQCVDEF